MALVIRGSRAYEYRSIRRGGKVTSEYVGGGGVSAESARFFRELEAGRRIERATARADWEAERARLDEAERRSIELDASYDELAAAALVATGHHRPQRGRWRRRRDMAMTDQNIMPAKAEADGAAAPIVGVKEVGELLDRIDRAEAEGGEKDALRMRAHDVAQSLLGRARAGDERALPALRVLLARRPSYFSKNGIADHAFRTMAMQAGGTEDVFTRELFVGEMERTRDEVAGPSASPLERILAERIALCRFDAHERDIAHLQALMGPKGLPTHASEYHSRMRDRANRRLLAACQSLATVRRLALPALQVSIEVPAPESAPMPDQVPFKPASRVKLPTSSRN
jgi:hypothetical protein